MNTLERAARLHEAYLEAIHPWIETKMRVLDCYPSPLVIVNGALLPRPADYGWLPTEARELVQKIDEVMAAMARYYQQHYADPDPIEALGAAIRQRATKEAYPWPEPVQLREDYWPFKLTNDSPP